MEGEKFSVSGAWSAARQSPRRMQGTGFGKAPLRRGAALTPMMSGDGRSAEEKNHGGQPDV